MALIKCKECKSAVSSKAKACPRCGAPIRPNSNLRTGCGCLLVILIASIAISAFVVNREGETASESPTASGGREHGVVLPRYKIVKEETQDTPGKTQAEIHAVVSEQVTEQSVRDLLGVLYKRAHDTQGFSYGTGEPEHIYVYVYTSHAHYASGMGQWIAMRIRPGKEAQVQTRIRTDLIEQMGTPPEVRFGLTESERKKVYALYVNAEDRADKKVREEHSHEPLSKQADILSQLTEKNNSELAARYGLTRDQLKAIGLEGAMKNWPMPQLPE